MVVAIGYVSEWLSLDTADYLLGSSVDYNIIRRWMFCENDMDKVKEARMSGRTDTSTSCRYNIQGSNGEKVKYSRVVQHTQTYVSASTFYKPESHVWQNHEIDVCTVCALHQSLRHTHMDSPCLYESINRKRVSYHTVVDISRIRTAFKLMQSTWTLACNHKPEHAVRVKWALVIPE